MCFRRAYHERSLVMRERPQAPADFVPAESHEYAGIRFAARARSSASSLAEIMRQAVEQEQIAGGSFLVAHKGKVVFREAFGYADIESNRPFTTDELLPIA